MSHYYYVLGHTNNPMILDYFEKFYVKLDTLFQTIHISKDIKEKFLKLPQEEQKRFFLKSDISTLILHITEFKKEHLTGNLQQEIIYLLNNEEDKCTYSLGNTIPGTDIKLTLHDNNPANDLSNHPSHEAGSMVCWGERKEEEWQQVYKKSFDILRELNPEFYNELNFIIQKIVPFGTSYGVHNSCSLKESIGNLYLGYTTDVDDPELNNLEALIHEASHNKLNLIMQHEKIIFNDGTKKFYSPYRPDARPVYGVYLGVHALVPTVYTMIQAIRAGYVSDRRWHEKLFVYHLKNKIGMKVLRKYAKCSPLGYEIMDELDDVMKMSDQLIIKTPELKLLDLKNIQMTVKHHFLEVQRDYPHLEY